MKTVELPSETVKALDLHDGDRVDGRVEVVGGKATFSIVVETAEDVTGGKPREVMPDLEAELREIFGDKLIPGPNPVIQERNQSGY